MARFDVYRTVNSNFVVDYQADFLDYLRTRFVIPLFDPLVEAKVSERLNPAFDIDGDRYVLYPQFAASIPVGDLQQRIGTLADQYLTIVDAFDMLTSGY